ncbi:MAG: hypothetical protein ACOX2Q_10195 [Dehalobacterium sp.]|jgi:uncharacterized membrane protein
MGRGGGSGGRRSGGSFGGNRSSGGRSSSSIGRGGWGRSSGSSRGGFSGSGIFGGGSSGSRSSSSFPRIPGNRMPGSFGGGFSGMPGGRSSNSGMPGCGCLTILIILLAIFLLVFILSFVSGLFYNTGQSGTLEVTKSTVAREPLSPGSVNETDYYTDELGWIKNETQLLAGLKNFYQKTGVQPYLFITDKVGGSHYPSAAELDTFARTLYDQLFTDEAHLLFVFFEYDNNYMDHYVLGTQAKTVIDREAADILLDYVDRYYYEEGLTDEEFFSKSFSDAADRIMTVTRSPWIPVWIVLGILVLIGVLFAWWRNVQKLKMLAAQKTKEILETPLDKFSDTEAENLAKKYQDPNNKV